MQPVDTTLERGLVAKDGIPEESGKGEEGRLNQAELPWGEEEEH